MEKQLQELHEIVVCVLSELDCYTNEQIKIFLQDFDWDHFYNDLIKYNGNCLSAYTKQQCPLHNISNILLYSNSKKCQSCQSFIDIDGQFAKCKHWKQAFNRFYLAISRLLKKEAI